MQTKNNVSAEIYTLYYDKVFGYVLNKVRNRSDAEDVTSEVFLKLFSKSDGLDLERVGVSSYIFKVMQTTLADFYRKRKIAWKSLEEIADISDGGDNFDDLLSELDRALDTLNERELEIVVLHYYYGLRHKEIAEKMCLSYSNVRQLCHVSIKKMREVMKDLCE